jgi:outer membrane usher protein
VCSVRRINGRSWGGAGWLLLCQVALADEPVIAELASLPGNASNEVTLYLDLTVNGQPAAQVVPVRQIGEELRVRAHDLRAAGVLVDMGTSWVPLDRSRGIEYRYDPNTLLLEVTVPSHWFEEQRLGEQRQTALQSVSGSGLALNYAAHFTDDEDRGSVGTLWSELRAFNVFGVLTHTGVHRYTAEDDGWARGGLRRRGYIRFDTAWSSSNEDRLHSWTLGDLVTSAQSWSTPVRLGGIKLARDFRLRPDVITYPLPQFSGHAALPTTLDLFINGNRVRSEQLRPGPYTITSIPFLTGAGEATVVTTDILGRQVATTLPFYASSELLRAGLTDYSLSVGAMRRDYGVESFSYGRLAGAGSLRYGVTNALTFEAQAEFASTAVGSMDVLGLGVVFNVGTLGIVSGSLSRSDHDDREGWQWTFGYRYANGGWNFGYQGTRRSDDFRSLANVDMGDRLVAATSSDIVTAGFSTQRMGSAAISFLRVQSAREQPARMLNLTYVSRLSDTLTLRIGASRNLESDEDMLAAQLLASFGPRDHFTLGAEQGGSSRAHFRYARSLPSQGGVGWNVGQTGRDRGQTHTDASLIWSGPYARAEAGIATDGEQSVSWADLRGSLLLMDNDIFAARQVSDAFVVVSTAGISDVPVRYENQLVGYTNRRGRLLVPWVTSHYAARFSIDPIDLPPEISIAETEQRLVVRRRSGTVLSFDMQRTSSTLIKLVDRDGAVVPVGSQAQERQSGQVGTVGYDGLVYFENPPSRIEIDVRRPDGGACRAAFDLSAPAGVITHVGPILCEPIP